MTWAPQRFVEDNSKVRRRDWEDVGQRRKSLLSVSSSEVGGNPPMLHWK